MIPEIAGAAAAAGLMAWGVRGRSAAVFAPSHWRGPRTEPRVALTFDDGPSESTPRLLEILASTRRKRLFFVCGMHVRRWPGIARQIAEAGHELGNHTQNHPSFVFRSAAFMTAELMEAQKSIEDATGVRPRLFRAPYGLRWPGLAGAQRAAGVTGGCGR